MSKYTTEVRFICESKSGLENSTGADKVDEVVYASWNKIFTTKAPFFDEEYRCVLCQKILKHYYLREICCETVGIWKMWMNERLEIIMPYYNQLYESAKLTYDPLVDVDLKRKHDRTVDGTEERNEESNSTSDASRNTTGNNTTETNNTENSTSRDLYSDTPQGAITGLENEDYLTNARKVTDVNSESGSNTAEYSETNTDNVKNNGTTKTKGTSNTTEDYLESITGKQGGGTYSKMLLEYRETFLNIDMQVIDEFSDLFFGLW